MQNRLFDGIAIKNQINISKQVESISLQLTETKNVFRRKLLHDQLHRLCNPRTSQMLRRIEWHIVARMAVLLSPSFYNQRNRFPLTAS